LALRPYRGLRLILYRAPSQEIRYGELSEYLESLIPSLSVELRGEFLSYTVEAWGVEPRGLARALASTRLVDLVSGEPVGEPLPGEVALEERLLATPCRSVGGVLYEGYALQSLMRGLIPPTERRYGQLHVVLTGRLLATREVGEGRVHARTIILGYPVLLSTSGLIEAPALPPSIYVRLQLIRSPDARLLALEEEKMRLGGYALRYGDERLTEVLKGYVLMGIYYHLFGEAFCGDPKCRLYNAHTQKELIEAQVLGARLCSRHIEMLAKLREGGEATPQYS